MSTAWMKRFREFCGKDYDISEHLGLLRGLAMDEDVKQIVEIGFRGGVSATALATAGKPFVAYDIDPCDKGRLGKWPPTFSFVRANSLATLIPQCELLHIDSLHTYDHLSKELLIHAPMCKKWIAIHDTETFGKVGKDGKEPGLMDAIVRFIRGNKEWKLFLHLTNNNGMSILRREAPSTPQFQPATTESL